MDADSPRKVPKTSGGSTTVADALRLAASFEVPSEVRTILDRELGSLADASDARDVRRTMDYLRALTTLPWEAPTHGWRDLESLTTRLEHEVRRHAGAHEARDRFLSHAALRAFRQRPGTRLRTQAYLEKVLERTTPMLPEEADRLQRRLSVLRREDPGTGSARTGSAMLLVGPPGVGKTRIAQRMAAAAGTGFAKVGLAGQDDASALRGFARTWTGAQPSRFATALQRAGRRDSVVLLDEVDKTGRGHGRGSPTDVLLEVLDGRSEFRDDYLDVALPLSDVCWIATANDLNLVPEPLRDRLDVVEVGGYTRQEREMIVVEDLWPQALVDHELVPWRRTAGGIAGADRIVLTPAAARLISAGAGTRDGEGLRETERRLRRLAEQLARFAPNTLEDVLSDLRNPVLVVDHDTVEDFLPEVRRHSPTRRRPPGFGPSPRGLSAGSTEPAPEDHRQDNPPR